MKSPTFASKACACPAAAQKSSPAATTILAAMRLPRPRQGFLKALDRIMSGMFRFSSVLGALIGLAVALPVAGHAADDLPLRPSSANSVEESYQLGTGDKVRVAVFGEDDLGGEFQVDGNGHISLPLLGEVTAAGETASGLEQLIAD